MDHSTGPLVCCALGRIRTCNLLIRSQMLYPLSYECVSVILLSDFSSRAFRPGRRCGTTLHEPRRHAKSIGHSMINQGKAGTEGPGGLGTRRRRAVPQAAAAVRHTGKDAPATRHERPGHLDHGGCSRQDGGALRPKHPPPHSRQPTETADSERGAGTRTEGARGAEGAEPSGPRGREAKSEVRGEAKRRSGPPVGSGQRRRQRQRQRQRWETAEASGRGAGASVLAAEAEGFEHDGL